MNDNKGWICPVCGKGLAPWKAECDCVPGKEAQPVHIRYPAKFGPPPFDPWGDFAKPLGTGEPIIYRYEVTSDLS